MASTALGSERANEGSMDNVGETLSLALSRARVLRPLCHAAQHRITCDVESMLFQKKKTHRGDRRRIGRRGEEKGSTSSFLTRTRSDELVFSSEKEKKVSGDCSFHFFFFFPLFVFFISFLLHL